MALQQGIDRSILCMFSGGIDSTGVLHKIMTDEQYSDYKLIVHHIHIINRENRARAEAQAVSSILKYYKDNLNRPFLYTESIFNTTGFAPLGAQRFPFDMDVCAFYAGNICAAREDINFVAMGRTQTDMNSVGQNFRLRMERAQKIFKSVLTLERRDAFPEYIFPVVSFTKKDIWEFLPSQVKASTWWCRRPVYQSEKAFPCGKCETCKTVSGFISQD